jgi:sensor domain CHASE-containing protein
MPEGLWPILLFIAVVVVYTIAKVVQYMKQSERQWQQVDKDKLKEWDDDDDWED